MIIKMQWASFINIGQSFDYITITVYIYICYLHYNLYDKAQKMKDLIFRYLLFDHERYV